MRKKTNKLLMKGQAVSVVVWMEMMLVSAGIGMLRAAGMQGCAQGTTALTQLSTPLVACCRSAPHLSAPRTSFFKAFARWNLLRKLPGAHRSWPVRGYRES